MSTAVGLLDVTQLSQMRKDGHPSIYGIDGQKGNDCSHWCLADEHGIIVEFLDIGIPLSRKSTVGPSAMGCHCRGIRHWDMLINSCFLVDALKQIGKTLGKEWNFSVDPCSGGGNWITPNAPKGYNNTVTCNCSYESNTICHVVSIDLSRNYLNGTIPPEWGTMEQLVNISLLGNRITGPIPGELSNISTLENL
ncbi:Non-specific serine/threonine protein kinase [Forsythia ovata]|uniref:Non-specific serine/threonine protein kinase n=1 Tax=Forsythia ovata TaxID=205694 RepID=A0ABD1S778_9LAMI